MYQKTYVKVAILSLVLLLSINSPAHAMLFPSVDFSSIVNTVQGIQQKVSAVKNQISSCKQITAVKNAIGDATASVAKFKEGTLAKAQAAAEKAKKEKEKLEERKRKLEEEKKKYEEKKAQYDEYQKKLEAARNNANSAQSRIEAAKGTNSNTTSTTASTTTSTTGGTTSSSSVKSSSQSSKNESPSKTSGSKADTSLSLIRNAKETNSATVASKVEASSIQTKDTKGTPLMAGASKVDAPLVQTKDTKGTPLMAGTSKVDAPSLQTRDMKEVPLMAGESKVNKFSPISKSITDEDAQNGLNSPISTSDDILLSNKNVLSETPTLQGRRSFSAPNSLVKETSEDGVVSKKIIQEELPQLINEKDNPIVNLKDKREVVGMDGKITDKNKKGRYAYDEQGNVIGDILTDGSIVDKTGNTISKILSDGTVVDKNGNTIGKSVPYNNGVQIISGAPQKNLNKDDTDDKLKSIKIKASEKGIMAATNDLESTLRAAVRTGDTKTLDAISKLDKSDIINSNSKKYEEAPTTSGRKAFSVEPKSATIPIQEKKIPETNNPFTKGSSLAPAKLQKNSYWIQNEPYQQNIKVSSIETLKFANSAGECTEYSNTIRYDEKEEVVVIPEALAKECCFKAEELTDMNLLRDCINKVVKKMNGIYKAERDENGDLPQDTEMSQETRGFYSSMMAEQVKNGIRDGLVDVINASEYIEKRFDPYVEQITGVGKEKSTPKKEGESSVQDVISSISMTNEEMMYLLNNIRRIYSSSLVSSSLAGMDNVSKETLDEETEIGIGNSEGQSEENYEYAIMRVVDKKNSITVSYPILPENFAKKYEITLSGGIDQISTHYKDLIQELNANDPEKVEVAQAFAKNIQYQELINSIVKSTYQKVHAAKYKQTEESTQDQTADASTERTHLTAMLNSSFEITQIIDDIVNLYASRLAYSSIKNITGITIPETSSSNSN